ncbi:MAG TPA: sensor domain-containing diguanylate cyclase [Candidatus Anaerobiospirillum stercoravium]|nr:sensor domain-containing diguanylate cyclase [Candidatus Anaerobiospirillum stercoravium]
MTDAPFSPHRGPAAPGYYEDEAQLILGDERPGSSARAFWIFDGETRQFLFDAQAAAYFGLSEPRQWIDEAQVLQYLTMRNIERYYRVMDTRDMGSIIFEDIEFTRGPHAGESFVINGSVLARFPDSKVRYATGFLTKSDSSYSDFIVREISGDGFFSWDCVSQTLHMSKAYTDLLGYSAEELPQTIDEWSTLVHPDDRDIIDVQRHILACPDFGDSFEYCARMRHKNGSYIWSIGRGIVVRRHPDGSAISMLGTFSDINLVQDNFENIKQLLYTDTLTGLKNRSFFQQHLARWTDPDIRPVSVIYADVTGLKITNDVLGHADGDILLLTVTEVLNTVIERPCDIMRLAGDEFLSIMPQCSWEECNEIVAQLRAYVRTHNALEGVMPLFVGFGCATLGEQANDTLQSTIERADVRMQAQKERERKDNYRALKAYLERRKGRPVSMRDGRRLNYLSKEERAARAHNSQLAADAAKAEAAQRAAPASDGAPES